ncbi:sigma factor-like helix-turn-helix DNA-binding protein [Amycolatopsis sp. NPDC004378]
MLGQAIADALLADAAGRLPPRQQLALRAALAGRSPAEIATTTGWSLPQVHRLLTAALRSVHRASDKSSMSSLFTTG